MHFKSLSDRHFRKAVLLIIACFVGVGVFVGIGAATEKIYDIYSLEDLETFREYINCDDHEEPYKGETVKLHTDIDLSSETNWHPIGDDRDHDDYMFHGTFDGQGHVISNLTINDKDDDYYDDGLFGATKDATIKNLVLKNVNAYTVGGSSYSRSIGSLIGWIKGGSVINCSVSGHVSAGESVEYVGGLIGIAQGNYRVENCSVSLDGDVTSGGTGNDKSVLGGLIGDMNSDNGCVSNCFVIGNGHSVGGSDMTYCVGGLIGHAKSEVSNCFVLLDGGSVSGGGSESGCKYVGGLIGRNEGNVINCSFSGHVSAGESVENIGGLIGITEGSSYVDNCSVNLDGNIMSDGTKTKTSYLGGLIGLSQGISILNLTGLYTPLSI